jgi:hypothetical protein
MKKINKIIPVFFLWLASLAITAHLIIPHDHHLAESVVNQDDSCPLSNSNTSHHTGFPIHCHAFNDLTSEKIRPYNVAQYLQLNIIAVISIYDPHYLQFSSLIIPEFRKIAPHTYFPEFNGLRAPPSFT